MRLLSTGLFVLLAISLLVGCGQEAGEESNPTYDDLVDAGRAALAQADDATAHDKFSFALEIRPHGPEASLGLALSDVLEIVGLVDSVAVFAGDLLGGQSATLSQTANPGGLAPGSTLGDTIHHFVKQIFEPVLAEMTAALDDAVAAENLQLSLEALPISLMGAELADLGGEWDAADARWLAAVARGAQGAVDVLQGLNLDADIGPLLATDLVYGLLSGAEIDYEAAFGELLAALLAVLDDPDKPDFLLPLPDQMWRFERAQNDFALATWYLLDAATRIDAERDDQADDAIGYEDQNGNGRRDAGEPYTLRGEPFDPLVMRLVPPLLAIDAALFRALAQGTTMDVDEDKYDVFDPAAFNKLLAAFGLPAWIPPGSWDLAAWFADPPTDELKETLIDALRCATENEDTHAAVACIAELFE